MCAGSDVYFCIKRQQPAAGLEFQRACVNWEAVYSLLMKSLTDTSGHVRSKSSRGEAQAQPECCQSVKVCYNQPSTSSPVLLQLVWNIFRRGRMSCGMPGARCRLCSSRWRWSFWHSARSQYLGNVIAVRGMNKL